MSIKVKKIPQEEFFFQNKNIFFTESYFFRKNLMQNNVNLIKKLSFILKIDFYFKQSFWGKTGKLISSTVLHFFRCILFFPWRGKLGFWHDPPSAATTNSEPLIKEKTPSHSQFILNFENLAIRSIAPSLEMSFSIITPICNIFLCSKNQIINHFRIASKFKFYLFKKVAFKKRKSHPLLNFEIRKIICLKSTIFVLILYIRLMLIITLIKKFTWKSKNIFWNNYKFREIFRYFNEYFSFFSFILF